MSNRNFDQFLSDIRNEDVDDRIASSAAERVWKSMAEQSGAEPGSLRLQSCENFQSLIPAYANKSLTETRRMLLEDHLHQCVACRRALAESRGELAPVWQPKVREKAFTTRNWALNWGLAAVAIAVIAIATLAFNNGLLPGQHVVRASVQNVQGSLYAVSNDQVSLIPAGYQIRNGDEIRTAKGSNAVVRLLDGSLVEMDERSDLSVSREWKGTTIHLDGGHVIVQAAKQGSGHLYVATDDSLVSVKGTIFSVNHGTKGSRVAVIEGVVRVASADGTTDLHAGEEQTSNSSVGKVPIQSEIAWSRNSAKYLALLGDFALLQKQFETIPGPGLRYSSDLLAYAPDHTVVYGAIPNLAATLGEATKLFQERLQQSPVLQSWWNQQQHGSGPKLDDLIKQIETFNSYLGDEIVFTVEKNGPAYSAPVLLARVKQQGLEDYLQTEATHLTNGTTRPALQVVKDPASVPLSNPHQFLVYINNGMLVATPDPGELQRAAGRIQQPSRGSFTGTPFYQQVSHAYQQGAGWLFCADMEQIIAQHVHEASSHPIPSGMEDVRFLTMERREINGTTENQAALTFASERHGIASWLAAPASMGGLEFVSPNASMVNAVVIKNPKTIMEELFKMIGAGDADFSQHLAEFESKTGVSVLDDITAPLGGEVTFAFDGPVLPTPRWKAIFEVYDPTTLQATIGKLVNSFNREATPTQGTLQLTSQQTGVQTFYTIRNSKQPGFELDYAYVDSYLVAGPDISTVSLAIRERQSGNGLTHSATFQALLPHDEHTNFSGIFYHNIGPVVGPLVGQIKAMGSLTPEQQQSITTLQANTAPGLIYVYGEPERIVVASDSGFMGFDLGTLLTMGQGSFPTQMFLGGSLRHPGRTQ